MIPQRMQTEPSIPKSRDYYRMAEAIQFIRDNARSQPTLAEISDEFGLHPHHFQRTFKKWTGLSPKRFLQHVTVEEAKTILNRRPHPPREASTYTSTSDTLEISETGKKPTSTALGVNGQSSLLNVSYDLGLSSPSRLHDLFIHIEAMSPNAYRSQAKGMSIEYGVFPSAFGHCLMAGTTQGLCRLEFLADAPLPQLQKEATGRLQSLWPRANLVSGSEQLAHWHRVIFGLSSDKTPVQLHLKGTNFQLQVWRALIALPPEALSTYGSIANSIGRPRSARAVGQAVGANPIAYLIPCHRVLASSGGLGGYAYGVDRKVAMLAWEGSREQLRRTVVD